MYLVKVRYGGATPDVTKREWGKICQPGWQETGEYWHAHYRAKHFTAAGAREYGYASRGGENLPHSEKQFRRSYTGRKLKLYGHTKPLVYTGTSEALTRQRDVRATGKLMRVVLHAPALNFKNAWMKCDMRAEMTRVSDAEQRQLVRVLDRRIGRELKDFRSSRTETL
jgi:hypothetical protein